MAFISATFRELNQNNPDRSYKMLANGLYIDEKEARAIRLGEKYTPASAYKVASAPKNNLTDKKTVLVRITNKKTLLSLSCLV